MRQIIETEKIPIRLWLDELEEGALAQAKNLANLPFAFHHIALMPDAHQGFGMPIGAVMAARDTVVPNAVGVDIGCGMCALSTGLTELKTDILRKIMSAIRAKIPLGFNKHQKAQNQELMPPAPEKCPVVKKEWKNALLSLGTLGGGNHFIEIQKGSDGYIWIMIHSGSRNLGLKVADYYQRQARILNEKMGRALPREWQLDYLPLKESLAREYLLEMDYCTRYALANRQLMIERVQDSFEECGLSLKTSKFINIAHNYAAEEEHFGEKVWVHRKGATSSKNGEWGIIPGSQGSESFIVRGKGNPLSFESCSHGAGRKMGRKEAQRRLDLKKEQELLEAQQILHSVWSIRDLDEAPSAYKNIRDVMGFQEDLLDIEVSLRPLAVIKG